MMLLIIISLCFFARLLFCLLVRDKQTNTNTDNQVKTLVVLGSGGHTGEMLVLLKNINRTRYRPIEYVIAQTDVSSRVRIEVMEKSMGNQQTVSFHQVHRSREVGQSYFTSIFSTFRALFDSFWLIYRINPSVLICNGPGTCVPLCFIAFFCRVFLFRSCPIIFVESFCRVKSLSLSGKLLYYIVARFIVQWPGLAIKYPRTEYIGRLC